MINEVLKLGATKRNMELKLFGGGTVLAMEVNNIGNRNIAFVRSFVRSESLKVVAEDLGGVHPRKVYFFPRSGRVLVTKLRGLQTKRIVAQEKMYKQDIVDKQIPGEIELFD